MANESKKRAHNGVQKVIDIMEGYKGGRRTGYTGTTRITNRKLPQGGSGTAPATNANKTNGTNQGTTNQNK